MDELMMWSKVSGEGRPIEYAFGPEWVAMALYMDDVGTETEDQAVLEWYFKVFKKRKEGYYVPTRHDKDVEVWMAMHPRNESQAILEWYHNVYKKEMHRAKGKDNSDDGQSGGKGMPEASSETESREA